MIQAPRLAETLDEKVERLRPQIGPAADAQLVHPAGRYSPHSPKRLDRQTRDKGRRAVGMDRAQPVGLAIVGSHFRQKLVVRHAGRSDKPQLVADAAPYGPGHVDGQRQTGFVFGHVQKSLVQRNGLDDIRIFMKDFVYLAGNGFVDFHPSRDKDKLGAQPLCLQ